MTVQQAWRSSLEQLKERGISEPDWSVAHLLANALDLPWSNGFSQLQRAMEEMDSEVVVENDLSKRQLTETEWNNYQAMIQRRLQDEPIQYILGKWDFLDYQQVIIRPPLLCPRPETEELVELVRKDIVSGQSSRKKDSDDPLRILDVGCGTGVIGIALADTLQLYATTVVTAIDIEPIAVTTSMENAKRILGTTNNWDTQYCALECSAEDYQTMDNKVDVVVSNPPYIPAADMKTLAANVIRHESHNALFGGSDDGMDVIRTIVRKWATEWGKRPNGTCWLEVDPTHPKLLQSWLDQPQQQQQQQQDFDGGGVYLESIHQDLSGRDRFVKLAFREEGS